MKTIIVLEDEAEAYDTLIELQADGFNAATIDWDRSKTILHEDSDGERRTRGFVEGVRSYNSYRAFPEIHDLMASHEIPKEVVLIVDFELIRDAKLIAHYETLHGLEKVDNRLVGGTSLAIQAIHNPAIESLFIYIATKHGEISDALEVIRHHIGSAKRGRRRLYEGKEDAKFNTKEKAIRILNEILVDSHPLDDWLSQASKRSGKANHDNWGTAKRPEQLENLWNLLGGNHDALDEEFGLLPGGRYSTRNPFCDGLKSFGVKGTPTLSLLNVAWIALAVLRNELDVEILSSDLASVLIQRILTQLDSSRFPEIKAWNEDQQIMFTRSTLLPPQSGENYRRSLTALFDMLAILFRNKDDRKQNNLLEMQISHNEIIFVLDFPSEDLVRNLRAMSSCLCDDFEVSKEHDSATAVYEFWAQMQSSDPTGADYGSLAYTWGQSGITLKKNNSTTELCFYVR